MGMFTWKTSDTGKTLTMPSLHKRLGDLKTCFVATLVIRGGEQLTGVYDGYGRLNGVDIFSAVMAPDLPSAMKDHDDWFRNKFFEDYEENMKLIKLVEKPVKFTLDKERTERAGAPRFNARAYTWEELKTSENCESQGFMPQYDGDYYIEEF